MFFFESFGTVRLMSLFRHQIFAIFIGFCSLENLVRHSWEHGKPFAEKWLHVQGLQILYNSWRYVEILLMDKILHHQG